MIAKMGKMSTHHITSSTISTSKEVHDSDLYVQPGKLKLNICFMAYQKIYDA